MALYNQIYLTVNGVPLAENTSVETSLDADIQDVLTVGKGWAGITPSPITRSVSVNNVVPLTGVEFDFGAKMMASEEVTIMMQEGDGGKKCVTKGYITNVPRSAGVGATTTISFTFKGTPAIFEG